MGMEWKEVLMEEIIEEISMGPFGSDIKKEFYTDSGIPVLNGSNLQGFKLGEESFGYVTEEKANSLKKSNAHRGDIIVTHRGTLGQIVYVPEDSKYDRYLISQSQFRFTLNKDLAKPEYVVYYFHTLEGQHRLLSNASQVGVPALARASTTFRKLMIPLPSIQEQQRIVDILSSLDAKIENNNKINAKLEEMTQALFKSWFIDFEPFKDGTFVESELGLIPSWFPIRTLGDIVSVSKKSINPGKTPEEIFAHYSLPAFDAKQSPEMQEGSTIMSNKFVIDDNTVLLSKLNPHIKRIWFVDKVKENAICSTEFIPFKANVKHIAFVYCLLNSEMFYKKICGFVNGATTSHQRLHAEDILNLKIAFDDDIMNVFCNRVDPMLRTICANIEENIVLAQTRDTLLPKLMSGEIEL